MALPHLLFGSPLQLLKLLDYILFQITGNITCRFYEQNRVALCWIPIFFLGALSTFKVWLGLSKSIFKMLLNFLTLKPHFQVVKQATQAWHF